MFSKKWAFCHLKTFWNGEIAWSAWQTFFKNVYNLANCIHHKINMTTLYLTVTYPVLEKKTYFLSWIHIFPFITHNTKYGKLKNVHKNKYHHSTPLYNCRTHNFLQNNIIPTITKQRNTITWSTIYLRLLHCIAALLTNFYYLKNNRASTLTKQQNTITWSTILQENSWQTWSTI